MTNIRSVAVNVHVDDLDAAIPLYQQLGAVESVSRFGYQDLQLARVGPFLLISGNVGNHPPQAATMVVASLHLVRAALDAAGAEIIEGPSQVPNGTRLVARHPDGSIFEYIQPPE